MTSSYDVINPYELLGVSLNCSIQELRRAYYRLCIIAHPDKGGTTQDMNIVQAAYQWILQQLQVVNERTDNQQTYEEKKADFKAFLDAQLNMNIRLIPMNEIAFNASGFDKADFDKLYQQYKLSDDDFTKQCVYQHVYQHIVSVFRQDVSANHDLEQLIQSYIQWIRVEETRAVYYASCQGGYGDLMSTSVSDGANFGTSEVVIYKEPRTYEANSVAPIIMPSSMKNYSLDSGPMDYQQAFMEHVINEDMSAQFANTSLLSVDELLELRELERSNQI